MKKFDMIYELEIVERHRNGRKVKSYKYGCTNQHAEDRAYRIEKSARENGHDIKVRPSKYYFNPSRNIDIGTIEHEIHSDSKYRHYDDGGNPFNGSSEIYDRRSSRKIRRRLSQNGIYLKKCGK